MENIVLPNIEYNSFKQSRDTIQIYAQLISAIKGKFVPHQKNWEEYSLKVYAKGFTSTSIPIQTSNGINQFLYDPWFVKAIEGFVNTFTIRLTMDMLSVLLVVSSILILLYFEGLIYNLW